MSDLPPGWASARIGDIAASMFDGPFGSALKTADYTDEGFRVARLENIGHLQFRGELSCFVSEEKFLGLSRHVLKADDVLFSSFVDKQTRVCLVPAELDGRMINKADCFCVRSRSDGYAPRLLAYRLAAPASYAAFSDSVRGVTRPRIGLKDLASYEIEVPPIAEQRRIVAKLDALTARTARARADLDRVPALAARYKQAVLAKAFSGELTAGVFGTGLTKLDEQFDGEEVSGRSPAICDLPKGWLWTSVGALTAVTGGLTKNSKRDSAPRQVSYLRVANVYSDELRLGDVAVIGCTESEFEKTQLRRGDVLIVEGNGSLQQVGRAAIWNDELEACSHQNHLIRLRAAKQLLPRYLLLWLSSPGGRVAIEGVASSSSGLHTLSVSKVKGLPLPLCGLDEQVAIVRRIDRAFTEIDRLTAEAAAARRLLERLDQAVLAKAFRGELVLQDPADEPASVLLDRIRAERAAAPKAKRGRKAAT